jgi:hypothetical protein
MWQIRIRRLLIIMALSAAWLAVARTAVKVTVAKSRARVNWNGYSRP